MNFNYFRIFLTLLASFAAFFAYICRLNLSLVINEMVIDEVAHQEIDEDMFDLNEPISLSSLVSNEERSLAWIPRSIVKIYKRNGYNRQNQVEKKITPQKLSQLYPLAIEVQVDKNKSNSSDTNSVDQDSSINNNASSDFSQPDQVYVKQNLLNWSESDQNYLLTAFFWGYVIFQIPSARAAEMIGAKWMFLVAGLGASFCSLIFPVASKCSTTIYPAFLVRLALGASQAGLFPTAYVFLCEWLPKSERSNWLPVPSAYSRVGAIVMNLVVPGILINYGWEAVFYVCGFGALIWCILFVIFGSSSPDENYWISKQELIYIESHMEPRIGTLNQPANVKSASGFTINESSPNHQQPSVNWFKMAKNRPILIMSLVMFTSEWSNMLLLIKLPGFLKTVLKMDVKEIANWSSILVGIYCIQFPLSGFCASKLDNHKSDRLNSLRVRKIFEMAAHLMQGIGCVMIAFSSEKTVVLSALLLIMLGRSTVGGGQCLMPPELSRDYPGTVFAFANTLANLAGIFGPVIVNFAVSDPKLHSCWFGLFFGSGLMFFSAGLIFCFFADNEPQDYCRKSKLSSNWTVSQAQLTLNKEPEEIFKMDAFSRVSSEPNPRLEAKSEFGSNESQVI